MFGSRLALLSLVNTGEFQTFGWPKRPIVSQNHFAFPPTLFLVACVWLVGCAFHLAFPLSLCNFVPSSSHGLRPLAPFTTGFRCVSLVSAGNSPVCQTVVLQAGVSHNVFSCFVRSFCTLWAGSSLLRTRFHFQISLFFFSKTPLRRGASRELLHCVTFATK